MEISRREPAVDISHTTSGGPPGDLEAWERPRRAVAGAAAGASLLAPSIRRLLAER